jgi:hypothetical protein
MWVQMKPELESMLAKSEDPAESRLFEEQGTFIFLRLVDGSVRTVLVSADGCATDERYEEWGVRAEKYGPPRFSVGDIDSWGHYEWQRRPIWRHPFKKVKVWRVRVWADGRLGEAATQ